MTAAGPIVRPLPENLEAEQALLGAILLNNEALHRVAGFLRPEHFAEAVHGRIYAVMLEVVTAGRRADPITLRPHLPADLAIGEMAIGQYLARLAAEATTVVNAPDYGRAVHAAAMLRQVIRLGEDMASRAREAAEPAALIAGAEVEMLALAEEAAAADPASRTAQAGYGALVDEAEARMASGRHLRGVSTGFASLDRRLSGFSPGQLILLAGRPGMGKTALGIALARRMAQLGAGVGFVSLEMPAEELKLRILADQAESQGSNIDFKSIGEGKLQAGNLNALRRAAERLETYPLSIIDQGNRLADLPGHIRKARRECARRGAELQVFMVDYLGLVAPSDRYQGQKVNEVGEVSAFLKTLAKRERLPVIALHQLSRAVETRDDKRPILADLRDSGNLEQDADVVMFVYREAYYLERAKGGGPDKETERMNRLVEMQNVMEVIVAKQRQGPVGGITLWCNMALNAVRDAA